MKILFVHQNFPGQFLHLAADLGRDPAHQVVALGRYQQPVPAGVTLRTYRMLRPAAADTHPLLQHQEGQVLHAEAAAAAALQLQREGYTPDVIVAHPGWGEALFLKDVFPRARLLIYCEYYYALEGQDVGFDPALPALSFAERCRLRLRNSTNLLSLELADAAVSPTQWQRNTYPAWARERISVIHDGIDSARLRHDPDARLELRRDGRALQFQPGDEVISYVARNLEPVRGFQVFMRMLPEVLRRRPRAHAVIVGGSEPGYGSLAPGGGSWKEHLLAEVGPRLDMARVHLVGNIGYAQYLQLLSVSRVHAYWTVPFVLSWSFLEAAASGVPLVASATAPVLEFAGRLGIETRGFFDQDGYADAIAAHCAAGPGAPRPPRVLPEIELRHCLARQRQWLGAAA
ncbi:glycosyltransferase [Duganella sp. CT11-25]|uniref:glycosyltransferase n=1 Tax=unclassified Duganella TaxID=2636909 RepID=UPI0039B010A9